MLIVSGLGLWRALVERDPFRSSLASVKSLEGHVSTTNVEVSKLT
jgi:hypothetical protein